MDFDVGVLRRGDQQIEGLDVADAFALHQNAFGHPDGVARIECGLPLVLLSGPEQRDGGVRSEHFPDDFGLSIERIRYRGVQI